MCTSATGNVKGGKKANLPHVRTLLGNHGHGGAPDVTGAHATDVRVEGGFSHLANENGSGTVWSSRHGEECGEESGGMAKGG